MANWISSKLKVAETFLQQIDQQAAESLRKDERPRSDDSTFESSFKSGGVVPLKDQLKKKHIENNDYRGKLSSDSSHHILNKDAAISSNSEPPSITKSSLSDSDWTQLLGAPHHSTPPSANRSNGLPVIRGLRKDGKKHGYLESKRSQKNNDNVIKSARRSDGKANGVALDGKPNENEETGSFDSTPSVPNGELGNDDDYRDGRDLSQVAGVAKPMVESMYEVDQENNGRGGSVGDVSLSVGRSHPPELSVGFSCRHDIQMEASNGSDKLKSVVVGVEESNAGSGSLVSDNVKSNSPLVTNQESDSDTTDSASTSGSESEGEREEKRKRRAQILADRAAAKAVGAIKERENIIAKLEGEKQSLEKILEERAKQQAQEASDLQTTMMETMEAAEKEKQKHNNTRMEALARLAGLESANADLSRSLATVQWNLEVEVNRVAELRQLIELKEIAYEDMKRRISHAKKSGTSLNQLIASKGAEFEREVLEAEYSFVTDKIGRLQDKVKKLNANIEVTRKEIEVPTEVEVELKRRLGQLTDHLIQKQAQVESLSSEKATLLFRIEAVSRSLDENESMLNMADPRIDLESGIGEQSNSKLRPSFRDKVRTGQQHLGSLLWQLDAIFSAGAVFLRRNSTARWWSLVYIFGLHLWVCYILTSHSQVSSDAKSGAIVSLENINNTAAA